MDMTVKNNGVEPFTGRHNGIDYVFWPKKPVTLQEGAARHIFGVGLKDKTEVLKRHGWLNHSSGLDAAMEKLNDFAFGIKNYDLDEEPVVEIQRQEPVMGDKERGPAPVHLERGNKSGSPDELLPPISTGGSILDTIKKFVTH